MTKREQRRFIRELIGTVQQTLLDRVGRVPNTWDGHELRQWIANAFEFEAAGMGLQQDRKRMKSFVNDVLTLGLLVFLTILPGCAARRPAYTGHLVEDDSEDLAEDSPTASDLRLAVHDALDQLHVRHARWDGQRFICPANTALWASEPEALEGRSDYVYCVKR